MWPQCLSGQTDPNGAYRKKSKFDKNGVMNADSVIGIAVVEDDPIYRSELCATVKGSPMTRLAGCYASRSAAQIGLRKEYADVVLLDLLLPDGSGVDVIHDLREHNVDTEFVVLTNCADDKYLFPALLAGASGYLWKSDNNLSELAQLVNSVVAGDSQISNSIAKQMLTYLKSHSATDAKQSAAVETITPREEEILELLTAGYDTKRIALKIDVQYETVRSHKRNIYKKLHARSAIEAVGIWRNSTGR